MNAPEQCRDRTAWLNSFLELSFLLLSPSIRDLGHAIDGGFDHSHVGDLFVQECLPSELSEIGF